MKRANLKFKAVFFAAIVAIVVGGWHFLETKYYPPILMYHSIDEQWTKTKLSVSPEQFREQMKFLREKHYNVISLEALADLINSGKRIPHNTVVITFDDGNENNYTNAFPVLKEYKTTATIFLVSDWIGKENFLNVAQIKEMSKNGIKFGSHSKTHPSLSELSNERLKEEILLSKRAIESSIGQPVTTFCFPFGGKNPNAKSLLVETGYKTACVTFPRDDSIKLDVYELKRIKVSPGSHNLLVFRVKTSGYYTWLKAHRWKKKK